MRNQLESLLYDNFIAPRQTYTPYDLGCPIISNIAKRIDFNLRNIEGIYKCSYYKPKLQANTCVVYLHSMGGSRIQSCSHAKRFVEKGIGFASFDFCGSGISEGNQNSLGMHSKLEVIGLIEHLDKEYGIEKVVLWGRSMGAAIAIKVMEYYEDSRIKDEIGKRQRKEENKIFGLILDSPFYSLNKIIVQIAEQKMVVVPKVLIKGTVNYNLAIVGLMRNTIENVTQCKLDDYELLPVLEKLSTPIVILSSKQDCTINFQHSQMIYNHYPIKNKELTFVSGNHTQVRDYSTVTKLVDFVVKSFKQNTIKSYSKQKDQIRQRQKQKKINCLRSQIFTKRISPQKNQTEVSAVDDNYQFPSDRQKHILINLTKLNQHKRALTQRTSLYSRNRISPSSRQPLSEEPRQGNLISVQCIPIKKKPSIISSLKPTEIRGLAKSPFSNIYQVHSFRKKPSTDRVTYESHEKYEFKRFLC